MVRYILDSFFLAKTNKVESLSKSGAFLLTTLPNFDLMHAKSNLRKIKKKNPNTRQRKKERERERENEREGEKWREKKERRERIKREAEFSTFLLNAFNSN